jgi:hypothetical protein
MAIASLTIRLNGTVAYVDGTKGSFAGVWDGKRQILPNGTPEVVAAKSTFRQTAVIDEMNDNMSDLQNPTTGTVEFTYSVPSVPGGTPAVDEVVVSFSGNVAYDDGSKGAFEVTHQKVGESLVGTNQTLLDIIADTAALTIMNNLLTAAAGFTLTLA